jgi:uncharacterized protein YggU (UPF0235/DUF167 family)
MVEWSMSLAETLTFPVRVRPGSSRTRVGGSHDGPLGAALVVAVNEPAVDGRATEAALRATADALGLRRQAISLRLGEASRDKLFMVTPVPAGLTELLRQLREGAA